VAFPRPPAQPHTIITPKHTANAAPKTWSSRDVILKNLYAEIMDCYKKDIQPLSEDAEWHQRVGTHGLCVRETRIDYQSIGGRTDRASLHR